MTRSRRNDNQVWDNTILFLNLHWQIISNFDFTFSKDHISAFDDFLFYRISQSIPELFIFIFGEYAINWFIIYLCSLLLRYVQMLCNWTPSNMSRTPLYWFKISLVCQTPMELMDKNWSGNSQSELLHLRMTWWSSILISNVLYINYLNSLTKLGCGTYCMRVTLLIFWL